MGSAPGYDVDRGLNTALTGPHSSWTVPTRHRAYRPIESAEMSRHG